ncbi:MAG: hypothetical protein BZ136_02730 [Methanosphaera sp. rholeuAM74]|nr:MAG: hypothetical protein BZ136_02730 [Methanosphaera sp. rholeuAM74]
MKIMGIDIGGANTDISIAQIEENDVEIIENEKKYIPMWKNRKKLRTYLKTLNKKEIDVICATITAELSDTYTTKKEGIADITKTLIQEFPQSKIKFVTHDGLQDYTYTQENPLKVAAQNWVATLNLVKHIQKDCIFIDMGTTTTDIIPIKNSQKATPYYTDLDRLIHGELVYTGMLRTNLATITQTLNYQEHDTPLASELFAITADMHIVLENITPQQYTCNTPDNKGKDTLSCKRRISRLLCADLDMLNDEDITSITTQLYNAQKEQIKSGLKKVTEKTDLKDVVITNYADCKITEEVAEDLGLNTHQITDYLTTEKSNVSTTIGAIQMYLEEEYPNIKAIIYNN